MEDLTHPAAVSSPSTEADDDLSALLGSRICHDLISPLGAIGNGVELLEMARGGPSPELALISESVEAANARIRLFRIAFGAGAATQEIGGAEIRGILAPMAAARRIDVAWDVAGPLPRPVAKLLCLVVLCCETALAWGGSLTVAGDARSLTATARAERLRFDTGLWEMLAGADPDRPPAASDLHFLLARRTADQLGRPIVVRHSDEDIAVSV
ncbi:histidine phosphotransferase [Rhodobacteraceae bacterium CCMM004]|nr:histidine phosphotransferase [Rhodobacteraceae bacterium CCMM004]